MTRMDKMEKKPILYRKKSLDRISEPDQLTDYLHVPQPMVWLLLVAILLVLLGLFCWSCTGTVDITAHGDAVVYDGQMCVRLTDTENYELARGMQVYVDNQEVILTRIEYDPFGRTVGYATSSAPDGTYPASVVVKSEHPFCLLFGV